MVTQTATEDEFWTREEAARALRLKSPRTLSDWEKAGHGPTPLKISPRVTLYSKKDVFAFLATCRNTASQSAEGRRICAITARATKCFEAEALKAIKNGTPIEDFDASLPSELRALMPPLDQFLANLGKPTEYAAEATAQAILDSRSLARK